jgi:hypothetical protein
VSYVAISNCHNHSFLSPCLSLAASMVFCCTEMLFKLPLVFTNEKHEDVHMYAVSAVEIVELLQRSISCDTDVIKFHVETHFRMYTEF